mgnify:CR=1 FL=1
MPVIKRALVSVSDKAGLDDFVKGLRKLGIEGECPRASVDGSRYVAFVRGALRLKKYAVGSVPRRHGGGPFRRDLPFHRDG